MNIVNQDRMNPHSLLDRTYFQKKNRQDALSRTRILIRRAIHHLRDEVTLKKTDSHDACFQM